MNQKNYRPRSTFLRRRRNRDDQNQMPGLEQQNDTIHSANSRLVELGQLALACGLGEIDNTVLKNAFTRIANHYQVEQY